MAGGMAATADGIGCGAVRRQPVRHRPHTSAPEADVSGSAQFFVYSHAAQGHLRGAGTRRPEIIMKQALHIFRKDVRLLWHPILVVLALTAAFAWIHSYSEPPVFEGIISFFLVL